MLVVVSKISLRADRVARRSGLSPADFSKRDALQMPIEEKISRADYVIENDGTLIELIAAVDGFFRKLKL